MICNTYCTFAFLIFSTERNHIFVKRKRIDKKCIRGDIYFS